MLIRTKAVGLNPADNLDLDYGEAIEGSLLGCDYAEIVEVVGSSVTRFKKGDRVCGLTRAGDARELENGTAAEVIYVKGDIALHIPHDMSFEDAATTGVTFGTTGRCLVSISTIFEYIKRGLLTRAQYKAFNIPFPGQGAASSGQILIYGGSSAMGTATMQFAKVSGFEVITTCSPHNFDFCKSYRADHVFDYHDPESTAKVKALTNSSLKLCIDYISIPETAAFCAAVMSPGAKYSQIMLSKCPRDDVEQIDTLGYFMLGEEWTQSGVTHAASQEAFEFSRSFAEISERLLKEGKVRPHPVDLREGGLAAIPSGLAELKAEKVSGKKIVVSL
jgi:NADPH:quinone reductase-like Zn-dependent oxidoreductase